MNVRTRFLSIRFPIHQTLEVDEIFDMKLNVTGKQMVYFSIVFVLCAILGVGWKFTARTSYESAEYSTLETDGPIEVRDYPDLMLVTTPMQSQGNDGSFGRLFRYISGGNTDKQNVAMTTPVFMEPEAENSDGQMGFVVPRKVANAGIPDPIDDNVQIQKRNGGRFAVIRFSGRLNDDNIAKHEKTLRMWIDGKQLSGAAAAEFAGYDPPWTPDPFRRNEVLIRLQ